MVGTWSPYQIVTFTATAYFPPLFQASDAYCCYKCHVKKKKKKRKEVGLHNDQKRNMVQERVTITTVAWPWIMTKGKLLQLSNHICSFFPFYFLTWVIPKHCWKARKVNIHSRFLCGQLISLFYLEVCPASFRFTWCFCRATGQGNPA